MIISEAKIYLCDAMAGIKDILGSDYNISLIARYNKDDLPNADIFISEDQYQEVIETLEKLKKDSVIIK